MNDAITVAIVAFLAGYYFRIMLECFIKSILK